MAGSDEDAAHYQRIADLRGPDDELATRVDYLLSVDTSDWDPWECARASDILLDAAYHLRRTKSAIQRHSYTARAQELAARAGNGPLQVRAYNYEAFLEMDRLGELQRAREHLETARRMAEDIPYREGEAWALRELRGLELSVFVDLHSKEKEPDTHAAREAIETVSRAALSKFESLGNVDGQAAVHRNLAAAAVIARDYESARVEYEIALRLERRLGDDYEIALALVELANINALTNRSRDAAMQYREALQLKQASVPWWELVDLTMLVQLAVLVGDQDGVCEHLDEMMQVATTQGDYLAEAHAGDDRTVRSTVTSKSITQFERGAA